MLVSNWINRLALSAVLVVAGLSSVAAEERAVPKPKADTSTKTDTSTKRDTSTKTDTSTKRDTSTKTDTSTNVQRSTEPAHGRIQFGDSPTFRQLQKMEPSPKKQEQGFQGNR
jgi:carbohydrate-binding DOMON domain-containing protein